MTDSYEKIAQSLFAKVKNGEATEREVRLAEAIKDAHSKGTPIDTFSFGLSTFESGTLEYAIPPSTLAHMYSPGPVPGSDTPSLPNRAMRRDMQRRLKQLRSE